MFRKSQDLQSKMAARCVKVIFSESMKESKRTKLTLKNEVDLWHPSWLWQACLP